MDSQVTETKTQSNESPWKQDFMSLFGFKQEGSSEPSPTPEKSLFQKVWDWAQPPVRNLPERNDGDYPTRGQRGEGFGDSFDTIFDRLLMQESRKQHTDKNGNLTKSPVGALGITQIMPETGKKPGYGVKPLQDQSEAEYLRVGRELLQAYTKKYGGDYRKGLAAYNYGPGNVDKLVKKYGSEWEEHLPAETKNYLKKVADAS